VRASLGVVAGPLGVAGVVAGLRRANRIIRTTAMRERLLVALL
jgi:hypothetical protein